MTDDVRRALVASHQDQIRCELIALVGQLSAAEIGRLLIAWGRTTPGSVDRQLERAFAFHGLLEIHLRVLENRKEAVNDDDA